jgi:hypothetical protein
MLSRQGTRKDNDRVPSRRVARLVVRCGHCRLPIEDTDITVIFEDASVIHVRCWRLDKSPRSQESNTLVRGGDRVGADQTNVLHEAR